MSTPLNIQNLRVNRKSKCICSLHELTAEQGDRINIQGLNGSGKSTLFRVIAGLEQNYQGKVFLSQHLKPIGFVQQNPYLFRGTVRSNLLYAAQGRAISHTDEKAHEIAERLELTDLLDRNVKHLSGGERRRVALGRTMILSPSLLLLDEPFAEMDLPGTAATSAYLDSLQETTILIATPTPLPKMPFSPRIVTID